MFKPNKLDTQLCVTTFELYTLTFPKTRSVFKVMFALTVISLISSPLQRTVVVALRGWFEAGLQNLPRCGDVVKQPIRPDNLVRLSRKKTLLKQETRAINSLIY